MASVNAEVLTAGASLQRETARGERANIQINEDTAKHIRHVRDAINDAAGAKVITNDDLVRLAFHSLGRVALIEQEGPEVVDEHDREIMFPLGDVVKYTTLPEDWLPDVYDESNTGGE